MTHVLFHNLNSHIKVVTTMKLAIGYLAEAHQLNQLALVCNLKGRLLAYSNVT